jgi:hypothetical protein
VRIGSKWDTHYICVQQLTAGQRPFANESVDPITGLHSTLFGTGEEITQIILDHTSHDPRLIHQHVIRKIEIGSTAVSYSYEFWYSHCVQEWKFLDYLVNDSGYLDGVLPKTHTSRTGKHAFVAKRTYAPRCAERAAPALRALVTDIEQFNNTSQIETPIRVIQYIFTRRFSRSFSFIIQKLLPSVEINYLVI